MLFTSDLLFIDVPDAGGATVTQFLLKALRRPVHYVSRVPYVINNDDGVFQVSGHPFQTLGQARELLARHGIELAVLPVILAIVRNPYDVVASDFERQWGRLSRITTIDEAEAPPPPRLHGRHARRFEAAVAALRPGRVLHVEAEQGEAIGDLRDELHQAAMQVGRAVEIWVHEGAVYVTADPDSGPEGGGGVAAPAPDFPTFIRELARGTMPNVLDRLGRFYHLGDRMPSNLRLVRVERLADDLRSALDEAAVPGDFDFQKLESGDTRQYGALYDAESASFVYDRARWLFDLGLYDRLEPSVRPAGQADA